MSSELSYWLIDCGLQALTPIFDEAGVEMISDLRLLTKDDLKELGIAVGPRNRLLAALDGAAAAAAPPPFTWRPSRGEIIAEATGDGPLPSAPPPPMQRVASVKIAQPQSLPPLPAPAAAPVGSGGLATAASAVAAAAACRGAGAGS